MGAHDPAVRRQQPAHGAHVGLEAVDLGRGQALQLHAVVARAGVQGLEGRPLALHGRGDDLAAAAVGDAVLFAQLVEEAVARDAQPRLQRPRRVIDPGVDHLAVAAGGLLAGARVPLQDHQVGMARGQAGGHGQAHDAGADHHDAAVGHRRRS